MDVNATRRRGSLEALSLGLLMVSVNATVVNIALPSIAVGLGFSQGSLAWIINAYLASLGGSFLVGGRLGDVFGTRRMFLLGVMIFTLASFGCAISTLPIFLIVARAAQGVGGAIMSAMALSNITNLFTNTHDRTRALGMYAFVNAGGGSIGVLLGGLLISLLGWRWVFWVNVPIGVTAYVLCKDRLPPDRRTSMQGGLDLAGALSIVVSLFVIMYAIENVSQMGWLSMRTALLAPVAVVLLALSALIEIRSRAPFMPLSVLRMRDVASANVAGIFLSTAILAWNFTAALYLQVIVKLTPVQVGVAFLPASLVAATMALAVTPILVVRCGAQRILVVGALVASAGLALLARAPVSASLTFDILPSMILLGIGAGTSYNPLLLRALNGVRSADSGVASGLVNMSLRMGGALGLSAITGLSTARTKQMLAAGADVMLALNGGYHMAFFLGAVCAVLAAGISSMPLGPGVRPIQ